MLGARLAETGAGNGSSHDDLRRARDALLLAAASSAAYSSPVSSPLASEGCLPLGSLVPCSLPLFARSLSEPRAFSSVLGPAEGLVSGER